MDGKRRRRRTRGAAPWARLASVPLGGWILLAAAGLVAANYAVQIARKPTELLGLVAGPAPRSPRATWAAYAPLFREHSTDVMRPELLAALVQAESAGDPLARTYWRLRWSRNPFEVYAPASSAVGILQITDGTFAEARRFCVHDHEVARDGPWWDVRSCWLNAIYMRTVPSHAIEMTSARLHQVVADTIAGVRPPDATAKRKRRLAAVVHLCGRERGVAFAAHGFRPRPGERCGDHDLAAYLARIESLEATFLRLDAGDERAPAPDRRGSVLDVC